MLVCVVGAVGSGSLMWDISDTLNGMMAIPNLIGLLMLSARCPVDPHLLQRQIAFV